MESERRKKIIVMKILVASIAGLIFIFWIFNIPNVWQANKVTVLDNSDSAEWDELKKEIDASLTDMGKKINGLEEKGRLAADANGLLEGVMEKAEEISSSTNALATSSPGLSASSTPVIPSNASSTPKNNCPPYINCMPNIGEARPCQIPLGCEGITQIAY